MEPGRELDELIAEKLMGWKRWDNLHASIQKYALENYGDRVKGCLFAPGASTELPLFSTSIEAAFQVVDKLQGAWTLHRDSVTGRWFVDDVIADTAPHAICLAALKACGIKID